MAVKAPGASSGGDSSSVDNAEVLIAIEELHQEIADLKNGAINLANALQQAIFEIDEEEEADVRLEIFQMVRLIGKTKSLLAAIQHPMTNDDSIQAASSELDEIVIATQTAIEDIPRSTTPLEALLDEILTRHPSDKRLYTLTE